MFSDILLTVDFDRTLTAPDSTIPERNLDAIRYFMANGGAFTLNTGRSVPMCRGILDAVPVNAPLLLYNGSAAYDPAAGRLTHCHPIQMDLWQTVQTCMTLFPDLAVEVQGLHAHYRFTENPAWDAFCDHNQCARGFAKPGDDLGPFLKFSLYGEIRDVTVADLYRATPEEMAGMDRAEEMLNEVFGETCTVFRAANRIIDVHAKGVSKLRAAQELKAQLRRRILVCVGAAHNDIPMLEGADFAYTPGDSAIARRFPAVCPCADGAVAEVIYEKFPEFLQKT